MEPNNLDATPQGGVTHSTVYRTVVIRYTVTYKQPTSCLSERLAKVQRTRLSIVWVCELLKLQAVLGFNA